MFCLNCSNSTFIEQTITTEQEFRGKTVQVEVSARVCTECKQPIFTDDQMDILLQKVADEYRISENLLPSYQIKAYRENLGMSQKEFAAFLPVGERSVSRWEKTKVQDRAMDELIREKCAIKFKEDGKTTIKSRTSHPSVENGYTMVDYHKLVHVLLALINETKSSLFIFKSLFYIDFLHFKRYRKSITGLQYLPLEYGPCPYRYDSIMKMMIRHGYFKSEYGHNYKSTLSADRSVFSEKELETIDKVLKCLHEKGARYLFDLSHQEKGYNETAYGKFLDYHYAKDLLID